MNSGVGNPIVSLQSTAEPPDRTKCKSRAFTLIELLVVIAIIGILASLLMPSLAGAKKRAHSIACVSNLRQIGMALTMYVDDNGNHLPTCAWPLPSFGTNAPPLFGNLPPSMMTNLPALPSITTTLMPYAKAKEVFHCPADFQIFAVEQTSYQWNGWLNGAPFDHPEDLSDITKVLVNQLFGGRNNTPIMGDASAFHTSDRNSIGANALFFDGRVERVKIKMN